jgi:hypothetical protein
MLSRLPPISHIVGVVPALINTRRGLLAGLLLLSALLTSPARIHDHALLEYALAWTIVTVVSTIVLWKRTQDHGSTGQQSSRKVLETRSRRRSSVAFLFLEDGSIKIGRLLGIATFIGVSVLSDRVNNGGIWTRVCLLKWHSFFKRSPMQIIC